MRPDKTFNRLGMERFVPLALQIFFAGTALVWRAWYQRRKFGITGVVLFRGDRAQHVRDAGLVLLVLVLGAQGVGCAFTPERFAGRCFSGAWTHPAVFWTGAALVLVASILMVVAQLHLGRSWRIGIDEHARPGLVTSGFFRFCRNPIFAFLLLGLIGFQLLLPTWLSTVALVAGYAGIARQVAAEEAWLKRAYGDAYLEYSGRVGRFLPWIGRLRQARPF